MGFLLWVCTEELSQRSIIFNHSASVKCKHSKKTKGRAERRILLRLAIDDQQVQHRGESLPEDHHMYSINTVIIFLNAGVLLSKMDFIPQQNASGLTDRRGMSDQVFVKKRTSYIRKEISGKPVKLGTFVDNQEKSKGIFIFPSLGIGKRDTWCSL